MNYLVSAWSWIWTHQSTVIEILLLAWGIANVVWAQWPKPVSPKAQNILKIVHAVFQLIVTHASTGGTFTWPWLIRAAMNSVFGPATPDPFGGSTEPLLPSPSSNPTIPDGKESGGKDVSM
jgi:hypothetical protein